MLWWPACSGVCSGARGPPPHTGALGAAFGGEQVADLAKGLGHVAEGLENFAVEVSDLKLARCDLNHGRPLSFGVVEVPHRVGSAHRARTRRRVRYLSTWAAVDMYRGRTALGLPILRWSMWRARHSFWYSAWGMPHSSSICAELNRRAGIRLPP